jgi:PadR family transcriptional regulator AphA
MKENLSTEFVLLGSLYQGPRHGYEIMQFLVSALESTWQVSTSQLYVLLKKLEQKGHVQANLKTQVKRPSKRVFSLTPTGRKAFLEWLQSPIEHVRDLRVEFLTKLFFFQRLCLEGGHDMINGQMESLKENKRNLLKRKEKEEDPFKRLVLEIKQDMIETWLLWLGKKAKPFMRKVHSND